MRTRSSRASPGSHAAGAYPRAYIGEQSYWTVFGVDGGRVASLLSEDGAVEPVPGVGALEPFLVSDGRVASWADARISHSLRDGDLPMPATPLARRRSRPGHRRVRRRQARRGASDRPLHGAQPRQADAAGGARARLAAVPGESADAVPRPSRRRQPDRDLAWDGGALWVNGALRLKPMQSPSSVRIEPAAAGPVGDWLAQAPPAGRAPSVSDADGFANAVLRYDMRLGPGEQRTIDVVLPVTATSLPARVDVGREQARVAARWRADARPGRHRRPGRGRRRRPDAAHRPRPHPRQPQRPGVAAGRTSLCAIVDSGRRADVVGAAAARSRRRRPRLPALVRAVPVQERQGAVLRHRARRRSRARERQRRRIRVCRDRALALQRATRRRPACCGRMWPRRSRTWSRCARASASTPIGRASAPPISA